jgi:hypothetical protein
MHLDIEEVKLMRLDGGFDLRCSREGAGEGNVKDHAKIPGVRKRWWAHRHREH